MQADPGMLERLMGVIAQLRKGYQGPPTYAKVAVGENLKDRAFQLEQRIRPAQRLMGRPRVVSPPTGPLEQPSQKLGPAILNYLGANPGLHPSVVRGLVEFAKTGEAPEGLKEGVVHHGLLPSPPSGEGPATVQQMVEGVSPIGLRQILQRQQLDEVGTGGSVRGTEGRLPGEEDAMYGARQRRIRAVAGLLKGFGLPLKPGTAEIIANDRSLSNRLGQMTVPQRMEYLGRTTEDPSLEGLGVYGGKGDPAFADTSHPAKGYRRPKTGESVPHTHVSPGVGAERFKEDVPTRPMEDLEEGERTRTMERKVKPSVYEHLSEKFLHTKPWSDSDVEGSRLPQSGTMDDPEIPQRRMGAGFSQADVAHEGVITGDLGDPHTAHNILHMQGEAGREKDQVKEDPWRVEDEKGLLRHLAGFDRAIAPLFKKDPKTGNLLPSPETRQNFVKDEWLAHQVMGAGEEHTRYKKGSGGKHQEETSVEPTSMLAKVLRTDGVSKVGETQGRAMRGVATDEVVLPALSFVALHAPHLGESLLKTAPNMVTAAENRIRFMHQKNVIDSMNAAHKGAAFPYGVLEMGEESLGLMKVNPALGAAMFKVAGTARVNPGAAQFMERQVRAAVTELYTVKGEGRDAVYTPRNRVSGVILRRKQPDVWDDQSHPARLMSGGPIQRQVVPRAQYDIEKVRTGEAPSRYFKDSTGQNVDRTKRITEKPQPFQSSALASLLANREDRASQLKKRGVTRAPGPLRG